MSDILTSLLDNSTKSFNTKAESIVIKESGWEKKVDAHKVDLQSHLSSLVYNCKERLLQKLSQSAQKDHELRLKDLIHEKVTNLSEHLSRELAQSYSDEIDQYNSNLAHVLKRGFGMTEQTAFDVLSKSELQSYDYTVAELKLVFRSQTNIVLMRKFNEVFKKDDSGKQRNWPDVEEGKIKEIWTVSKTKVACLLDEFKKIILPRNLTVVDEETQTPRGGEDVFVMRNVEKRMSSLAHERILSEEEISRVSMKFNDDIEFSYEEALSRHVSILKRVFIILSVAQYRDWRRAVLHVRASGLVR